LARAAAFGALRIMREFLRAMLPYFAMIAILIRDFAFLVVEI
jgi:hypothetical protein